MQQYKEALFQPLNNWNAVPGAQALQVCMGCDPAAQGEISINLKGCLDAEAGYLVMLILIQNFYNYN